MSYRVLICDDAKFMRTILRRVLEKRNYNIVGEACNGKEAIRLYRELKPDVVTMDVTMPEMDGISAIREICAEDSNAKVIVCSAMGQKYMVLDAIQAGAKDFIVKPFDAQRIYSTMEKVLGEE